MLNFWKQKKDETTKEIDPKNAKARLFAGCPVPAFAAESEVIERLEAISSERLTLSDALRRTRDTIETEQAEIARLDAERVERLADFAKLPPQDDAVPVDPESERARLGEQIEALRVSLETKKRAVDDAERTASVLQARLSSFNEEASLLRQRYGVEVGKLLNAIYAHLSEQYMQQAPAVAELLLQIAAVQDVMMHFRVGNSNGFDRRAYLPTVEPGSTRVLPPLADCSQGLAETTEAHRKAIIASLGAIGYRWRFDG